MMMMMVMMMMNARVTKFVHSFIHSLHSVVLGGHTGHETLHYLINLHLTFNMSGCMMNDGSAQGPLLRPIQRYGKQGKRSGAPLGNPVSVKDPRYMYLSIDEACTHVRVKVFRYGHIY
jgi:hypothetical protein